MVAKKKDNKLMDGAERIISLVIKLAIGAAVIGGTYGAASYSDGVLVLENSKVKIEITFKD